MLDLFERSPGLLQAGLLATALTVSAAGIGAHAQGLDSPEAIDKIVGSEVHEEETEAAAEPLRVIAAIEQSAENTSTVRKITNLDRLDIVFLPDASVLEGGPPAEIVQKLSEYDADIEGLRQELRGNAMLFHAIDSRNILVEDVLAIEFDDANGAVIYAASKPPA